MGWNVQAKRECARLFDADLGETTSVVYKMYGVDADVGALCEAPASGSCIRVKVFRVSVSLDGDQLVASKTGLADQCRRFGDADTDVVLGKEEELLRKCALDDFGLVVDASVLVIPAH